MDYPILVTAAVIERDGEYLITQRPDDGRHNSDLWEFPGGKVDFGETPRSCLEREIDEELGIKIKAGDVFECSSHVYSETRHVVLLAFLCKYISGEIQHKDIKSHAWVTPDRMKDYDISIADLPFVEKLRDYQR